MFGSSLKSVIVIFVLVLINQGLYAAQQPLYETSFKDGASGWTLNDQAFLSEISRRKGTKSLLIKQWDDKEKESFWLSPAIKNPGKPVAISFWAADNYLKMTDFSYAAVVDVISYDKAGKELNTTWYLKSIPWDQSRKSDMWGVLLPEGLKWNFYQAVCTPKGETFKVKFHWRKPIIRGECYLTDLQVREASPQEIAAAKPKSEKSKTPGNERFKLELSTPVTGNLFYRDDPLQFEILLLTTDDKEIGKLKNPVLHYEVTDFEFFNIAKGKIPFNQAKPVADKKFSRGKRKFNLHQPIILQDQKAKLAGQEFFIKVDLLDDGKIIASDTVTYGVVNPRKLDPKQVDKCRFPPARRWQEDPGRLCQCDI